MKAFSVTPEHRRGRVLTSHHSCVWRVTLPLLLSWAWQVQDAMLSVQKHGWGAAVFAAQVLDAVVDCASYMGTLALVDTCGFDNHHWFSRRFIFAPHSSWGDFKQTLTSVMPHITNLLAFRGASLWDLSRKSDKTVKRRTFERQGERLGKGPQ